MGGSPGVRRSRPCRAQPPSAAAAWDLLPSPAKFDVSTLASLQGRRREIRVHRGLTISRRHRDDDLPVTTVARTLIDLATILTPHQTERVVHRAQHLRLLDIHSLNAQLARAQGRPTRWLRAALATLQADEPQITRSELEERFLFLILNAQLPRPETNVRVGPYEVDFFWRAERLMVEIDGRRLTSRRRRSRMTASRDAVLSMMGSRTLRFTWRQVLYEPALVLRAVEAALRG